MARAHAALTVIGDEASAYALADALEALEPTGVGAFEIEDGSGLWEVAGYFDAAPDGVALDLLAAAHGARAFAVSAVDDRDWVAQVRRELHPVWAGRVVVFGGHDRARIPINAIRIEIEAAMAFGTGHHATTEGCLLAMNRLRKEGRVVRRAADIGCGTGVLAMAAAKLWPATAVATDIDAIAAETARANARANGVAPRLTVGRAVGARHPAMQAAAPYDLVLANILARPLKRLAPEIAHITKPGGTVVLSGLLDRQKMDVFQLYRCWGFRPCFAVSRRGWTTLAMRR